MKTIDGFRFFSCIFSFDPRLRIYHTMKIVFFIFVTLNKSVEFGLRSTGSGSNLLNARIWLPRRRCFNLVPSLEWTGSLVKRCNNGILILPTYISRLEENEDNQVNILFALHRNFADFLSATLFRRFSVTLNLICIREAEKNVFF